MLIAAGEPMLDFDAGRLFGPAPAIVCTVFWAQTAGAISPITRIVAAARGIVCLCMDLLPSTAPPKRPDPPTKLQGTSRKRCILRCVSRQSQTNYYI